MNTPEATKTKPQTLFGARKCTNPSARSHVLNTQSAAMLTWRELRKPGIVSQEEAAKEITRQTGRTYATSAWAGCENKKQDPTEEFQRDIELVITGPVPQRPTFPPRKKTGLLSNTKRLCAVEKETCAIRRALAKAGIVVQEDLPS